MQKLRLSVEELEVTSFKTETLGAERGTIAAHDFSGLTCVGCQSIPTRINTCCTPVI